jgi:uncharacterized protein YheU (UPF0270 family)
MFENKTAQAIQIPLDSLKKDILEGVIKDYILREGTDYGDQDFSLEEKISQVHALLIKGKACIFFDPNTETCTILDKHQIQKTKQLD